MRATALGANNWRKTEKCAVGMESDRAAASRPQKHETPGGFPSQGFVGANELAPDPRSPARSANQPSERVRVIQIHHETVRCKRSASKWPRARCSGRRMVLGMPSESSLRRCLALRLLVTGGNLELRSVHRAGVHGHEFRAHTHERYETARHRGCRNRGSGRLRWLL